MHTNEEWIERMKNLSSSLIADVMDVRNTMHGQIKPMNFSVPLVGQARTVALPSGDNLLLHHAIYQADPGDILIVDGKGYTEAAYLGELMAGAAQALGIQGMVVDGLVRDHSELQQLDIQIYAKGFMPNGPSKEGPGAFDTTISCAGAVVSPGDYVVGDQDGVVIIPSVQAEEIIRKAEQKQMYENERLETIRAYEQQNGSHNKHSIQPAWLEGKMKTLKSQEESL